MRATRLAGAAFGGIGESNLGTEARIFAHGLAGGAMAGLQGGSFGHGFIAAGLTKAINVKDRIRISEHLAGVRITIAAIIGGTISEPTGGQFGNGALSAVMAQALNGKNRG